LNRINDDFGTRFHHITLVMLGLGTISVTLLIGVFGFLWDIKTDISALQNDRTLETLRLSSPQAVPALTPVPAQQPPPALPAETPAPPNQENAPSETPSSEGLGDS
jgi:hypothetical protein